MENSRVLLEVFVNPVTAFFHGSVFDVLWCFVKAFHVGYFVSTVITHRCDLKGHLLAERLEGQGHIAEVTNARDEGGLELG